MLMEGLGLDADWVTMWDFDSTWCLSVYADQRFTLHPPKEYKHSPRIAWLSVDGSYGLSQRSRGVLDAALLSGCCTFLLFSF